MQLEKRGGISIHRQQYILLIISIYTRQRCMCKINILCVLQTIEYIVRRDLFVLKRKYSNKNEEWRFLFYNCAL